MTNPPHLIRPSGAEALATELLVRHPRKQPRPDITIERSVVFVHPAHSPCLAAPLAGRGPVEGHVSRAGGGGHAHRDGAWPTHQHETHPEEVRSLSRQLAKPGELAAAQALPLTAAWG
jgi:hypothetical protein